MLDDILDALDMPRQALTNMARSAFGDSETGLLGSLPGLAGAVGTGLLGLTGVGLPLALAGGSALAGLGQGIGKTSGRNEFNAPTAGEVAKGMFGSDDFLPSILAGMVTDPLTYIGGIGGSRIGKGLGKGVEAETVARGPGYQSSFQDLMSTAKGKPAFEGQFNRFDQATQDRILSELPPTSRFLSQGIEGSTFLNEPTNEVFRFSVQRPIDKGRIVDPDVLQPTRTVDIPIGQSQQQNQLSSLNQLFGRGAGQTGDVARIERMPFAEHVDDPKYWIPGHSGFPGEYVPRRAELMSPMVQDLKSSLASRGLDFSDTHLGNVGTLEGANKVIDPGAMSIMEDLAGNKLWKGEFNPVIQGQSGPGSLLSRLIGAQGRFRNSLDTGANFDLQTILSRIGGGLGTLPSLGQRSMIESNR